MKVSQSIENEMSDHLLFETKEITHIENVQKDLEEMALWGIRYLFFHMLKKKLVSNNLYSFTEINSILQIHPKHISHFNNILQLMVDQNLIIEHESDCYELNNKIVLVSNEINEQKEYYDNNILLRPYLNTLKLILDQYQEILSNEESLLNILFTGGKFDNVNNLYRYTAIAKFYNQVVVRWLNLFKGKNILNENICILELGAGTGATTLEILESNIVNSIKKYHYTDISNAFLAYGIKNYQENFPCLEFFIYNINKHPSEYGINTDYYHVVLATNVIHNSADIVTTLKNLKTLLKDKGILILIEGVNRSNYFDLIYGLTPEWWNFNDKDMRINNTPLIDSKKWKKLFIETGFEFFYSLNENILNETVLNYDILLAGSIDFESLF